MNRIIKLGLISGIALILACGNENNKFMINSPDGNNTLVFILENGIPKYSVIRDNKTIIDFSKLGFKLKNLPPLDSNFAVTSQKISSFDETWEQPWGEKRLIQNNYTEISIALQQKDKLKRKMTIVFRLYDYGLGFRYEIPKQDNLGEFAIMDEETEFILNGNHSAWWIPAYRDNRYEYLYSNTPVNSMDTVHTPLTMKTDDGLYLSFHEAALNDYASMTICSNKHNGLKCDLVPWSDGVKVYTKTPMKTPWRTIQIVNTPGDLITTYLILNLNEPNKLDDVSYIKPGKYVGIWWGMHIGMYTWSSGPKHGATTKNAMKYIDFAANYGFSGVLIEGWNEGWEGDWAQNGSIFNFTKPYPDCDIKKITQYAESKGVKIIGHHETGADVDNYGKQMDDAYKYYKSLGIDIVKSGYVGSRLNKKEWHHGQFGVNFYNKALTEAAKYQIMLIVHEPIKSTGIRRTYPNMMTSEGARGTEYDAWSTDGGNPPDHTTILPFTRLLAGPMDFTPGVFDIKIKEKPNNQANTTIARQLAYYVVIYSPFQMACDLPENYEENPEPFQFIRDVPTDWEDTKVLNGEIGEYITVVRKARNSDQWFLGSITNEKSRDLIIDLGFLDKNRKYHAQIYADGATAHWKSNPLPISISEIDVTSETKLKIKLAPGGGQAICFYPYE